MRRYNQLKELLSTFNAMSKKEVVESLKNIKQSSNFEGETGGNLDHAHFIEGQITNMLKYINNLLLIFPDEKSKIYEQIRVELFTYSDPIKFPYINAFFKNKYGKSTIRMVEQFLINNYQEDYEEFFKTRCDENIENFDN